MGSRFWPEVGGEYGLFVDGEFVDAATGELAATVDPATGAELARVAVAGAADVDAAVRAAAAAVAAGWGASRDASDRAKHLFRLADLVSERSRELAALETRDQGKPIRESADLDVPLAAATLFSYAGWADKLGHAGFGADPRPVGVVAGLLPWTFPLASLAWAAAPALACGNAVVLKPAASTPLTALAFAELCAEAGLPAGVVNVVTGADDTGRTLVAHPGVGAVTLTGSVETGRAVARALAGTGRRLTADLGGRAANIVFADAPLASAVDGIVDGFLLNGGQGGGAGARLLVQESVHDEVVAAVKARVATLRLGDPGSRDTDLGPLHTPERVAAVHALCRAAQDQGAVGWSPEVVLPERGNFLAPTVFTEVAPSSTLAREPVGGPVLGVLTFRTEAEAVALANNTPYGRAVGVWTDKGSRAAWMARHLRSGVVWVNCFQRLDPTAAFGGHRESGLGVQGGRAGLGPYLATNVADVR